MLEAAEAKATEAPGSSASAATAAESQPAAALPPELAADLGPELAGALKAVPLEEAPRRFVPANPTAAKKPFRPANPAAAERRPVAEEQEDDKPPKKETKEDRQRRHFLGLLKTRNDEARVKALQYGKEKGLLAVAPLDVLLWGVEHGHLLADDVPGVRPAAPRAAAPAQQQPTPGAAGPAAGAVAAQQQPPPPPMLAMGVPVEDMKRAAFPAALLVRGLCQLAKRPGFDPNEHLDMTLGRGQPWEFKLEGIPVERFTELVAAEAATTVLPKMDAGSPWMRRVEIAALGSVLLGPLVKARLEELWQLAGRGVALVREKRQARRAGQ